MAAIGRDVTNISRLSEASQFFNREDMDTSGEYQGEDSTTEKVWWFEGCLLLFIERWTCWSDFDTRQNGILMARVPL